MNHSQKISLFVLVMLISSGGFSFSAFSQHFNVQASFGAGQASGGFDSKEFAFSSQIGFGYETKSEIVSLSASIMSESYNFYEENDLMVFSLPVGCQVHTRTNPKPYLGVSLAPSYPTQWLVERKIFLTGGITGGVAYSFKKLSTFAQFEYLAGLTDYTGLDYIGIPDGDEKFYLNRYYISLGVKVRL